MLLLYFLEATLIKAEQITGHQKFYLLGSQMKLLILFPEVHKVGLQFQRSRVLYENRPFRGRREHYFAEMETSPRETTLLKCLQLRFIM